ncbi:3-keto-5-aminohexanoate cleavage protein [Actinocatenispora rupis]|uniref:3-keto-5-aminohexanoate cleavage protein n=1 Tax=Actinocatenispora rupis TaxID=519421 RepID=UPI001944CA77|nr:3-keto-5-aminohexanoate cleavage protein [Actinocatenispora rupis]
MTAHRWIQTCLNGARTSADGVPVTPAELAAAAAGAVAAGATDIHLHPKDDAGRDTLDPTAVAGCVTAVRAAAPGVPVGVTTGAWTEQDPNRRAALVRAWPVLPDHASVNWHEDGADDVADALTERGVGIEAGLWSGTDGARRFRRWPGHASVLRILAEVTDTDPATAPDTAVRLLDELADVAVPVLLHGEDGGAWPVLRLAVARGLATRVGLEDTLTCPDGTPAADNATLVRAALTYPWPA